MVKINFIDRALGSGFYTGYVPLAPGTFGSIAALLLYSLPGFESPPILISMIIIFSFYGIYVGGKFESVYGKDPSQCTIDEMVGMWISLLFLPKTIFISLFAFVVWRIMDIIKPYPARQLEKLKGGLGIMLDDIVASIYSFLIVHLILRIFTWQVLL